MFRWIMLFLLAPALAPTLAQAADFSDPTWPCVQRKVPNLSVGQMWAGPLIEKPDLRAWRKVPGVAQLAPVLALRRTSDEAATALITDFAGTLQDDRDRTLTLLFAGTFSLIERERSQVIQGIGRYAQTQITLSKAIETAQNALSDMRAIENPDFDTQDRMEELEDRIQWDTRIFKDRQQSLTYVCETPVILERRAFAIARTIMAQMN